jgi:aspartate/glutamate racemase
MSEKSRKLLGIIEGMGAEAGALLFHRLIKLTPVEVDQDHIETLLYSTRKFPTEPKGF